MVGGYKNRRIKTKRDMKVKAITKYTYKGKEYNSLKDIQNRLHDIIGEEVIDKISKKIDIRHKDLFVLLDIICSKEVREVLTEVLRVEVEQYNEFNDQTEVINVLDLK